MSHCYRAECEHTYDTASGLMACEVEEIQPLTLHGRSDGTLEFYRYGRLLVISRPLPQPPGPYDGPSVDGSDYVVVWCVTESFCEDLYNSAAEWKEA